MTAIPTASWRKIVDELRRGDAGVVRAWLYDLEAPGLEGGIMTVRTRNDAQREHLERYSGPLARSAQSALGRLVTVRVEVGECEATAQEGIKETGDFQGDFTLGRFVVAPENQLAHAAATRALEGGAAINPLFIYGPHGSGKTHLLQALCQDMNGCCPEFPGKRLGNKAVYRTAGQFVAEFTKCFEEGVADGFRRGFVQAGLVTIDDVEGLGDKPRSQEELFHILNSLMASGIPILLASDRPPAAIGGLEDRLASRFSAGLVIALDAPGVETRLRILERKNADGSFGLSGEVLAEVARRCTSGDLANLLSRLDALAASNRGSVTMDLVDDVLRDRVVAGVA